MKKRFLSVLVLAMLTTVSLLGCGSTEEADNTSEDSVTEAADAKEETSEDEKVIIRIADQPGCFVARIAEKEGFYEKELGDNVEVEIIDYPGGGPAITESFSAGEVDFGFLGDLPVITNKANGSDIKIVGYSFSKEETDLLVTLEGSGITSLEDLKGKKIGVAIGTTAHSMILKQLDSVGLTENDVELVNLSFADCVTSLVSGDIDAASSFTTFVLPANKDGANIVTVSDATGLGISNTVIAASGSFTDAHPKETAQLLKAFDDAVQWIAENKDESISFIAEYAEQDPEITTIDWEKWKQHIQLTEEDIDAVEGVLEFAEKQELIENEVSLDELIDTSYLEAAGLQ